MKTEFYSGLVAYFILIGAGYLICHAFDLPKAEVFLGITFACFVSELLKNSLSGTGGFDAD